MSRLLGDCNCCVSSYKKVRDSLSNLGFRSTFTFRTHTSLSGKTDCVRFSISRPIESGILNRRNQQTRSETSTSSCSATHTHTHVHIVWHSKNLLEMRHCNGSLHLASNGSLERLGRLCTHLVRQTCTHAHTHSLFTTSFSSTADTSLVTISTIFFLIVLI